MSDTTGATTTDPMPTTTVSKTSAGIQTSVPPALVDALGLADLDTDHRQVAVRVRCSEGGPVLDLTIGAVDGPFPTRTASVKGGRYCYLSLPRFVAEAWDLEECELQWPDAEAVKVIGAGETIPLQVEIDGWTSPVSVGDLFLGHSSTVSVHETDRGSGRAYNYTATVPAEVARAADVYGGGEVAVRVGCRGGRPVAELSPDGIEGGDGDRPTVTVTPPTDSNSPRIVGQALPAALGVLHSVHDEGRARLSWGVLDGRLVVSPSGE